MIICPLRHSVSTGLAQVVPLRKGQWRPAWEGLAARPFLRRLEHIETASSEKRRR
jgi:hypothetical protein